MVGPITAMTTGTPMTDLQSLIRLQTWLSPAFPTGAFSYSHGLEQAIADKHVHDQTSLIAWLSSLLEHGAGWSDAIVLSESWRVSKSKDDLFAVAELSEAMSISKERHLETVAQGSAFLKAASVWRPIANLPEECTLPVAVGAVAAHNTIALPQTLTAFLHAYVSNQIQAALRLMKLGQQGGVEVLATLEPLIINTAERAEQSSLDDLGSSTFMADICTMQHEKLETRIFRS